MSRVRPGQTDCSPFEMKTVTTAVLCALCAILSLGVVSLPAPPFFADILKQCHVVDKGSLDNCLYNVLVSMKPYLVDGISEWNVPVLEPLKIKGISFNQGGGNIKIRAQFRNLKVSGLTNFSVSYVKTEPESYKFSVGLQFPKLHIEGEYNLHGNILLIPIKGQGPFWADFRSVKADSYNYLDVVHPAGEVNPGRLHLARTQTDFDIGNVKLRLEELFNNDEFLGETVNTFLNENAQEILCEVKPQFAREIDRLVVRIFGEVIPSMPLSLWERLASPEAADKLNALNEYREAAQELQELDPKLNQEMEA